jgi:hypothetical protein
MVAKFVASRFLFLIFVVPPSQTPGLRLIIIRAPNPACLLYLSAEWASAMINKKRQ